MYSNTINVLLMDDKCPVRLADKPWLKVPLADLL